MLVESIELNANIAIGKSSSVYSNCLVMTTPCCLSALLSAAKLQPNNPTPFAWLGHYYIQIANDTARAKQCYSKALSLAPGNGEAGKVMVDMLIENNQVRLIPPVYVMLLYSFSVAAFSYLKPLSTAERPLMRMVKRGGLGGGWPSCWKHKPQI